MEDSSSYLMDAFVVYLICLCMLVAMNLVIRSMLSAKPPKENNRPFRKFMNIKLRNTEHVITSFMPLSRLKK